jgi:type IV pilus assembly protein PilA
MMRSKKQKGFSLIELLIVVAIILIIAAIAIPNLLRSRMAANEASAVGSLRTLNTAAVTYSTTYGNGFPPTLASMGPVAGGGNAATCDNADLVDSVLAAGQKSGYNITYTGANAIAAAAANCANAGFNTYTINADPVTRGTTGQRSFFTDESGVIRFNATQAAAATDAPIS